MENQKLENQLNLALDSTNEEREQSLDLDVGFDPQTKVWELIVKYSGSLAEVEKDLSISVTELLNEYAVLLVPEDKIPALSAYPQIEFIEKPKGLAFAQTRGIIDSCIQQVRRPDLNLFGAGTIVGIVDSGIDYRHPAFRKPDGTTRIIGIWDQSIEGNPPTGYRTGNFYSEEQINEALAKGSAEAALSILPSVDLSGHGTHVAGIACGNQGVAPQADIAVVKLGNILPGSFPRTTQLMEAVDYLIRLGIRRNQPVAVNLSFGNNYGGHDGSSLLETFLDNISNLGRNVIVCGTGNEGASGKHVNGRLINGERQTIEFAVSEYEPAMNLQIWKSYVDQFRISLISPGNDRIGPLDQRLGVQRFRLGRTNLLVYFGEPAPYNRDQEIYIEMLPVQDYIEEGIWKIELTPERIVVGRYDLWLPVAGAVGNQTRFLFPSETTTLTIPSTAFKVLSVGAYDTAYENLAPFSGRGYTRTGQVKPDLTAPGVNIESASPGGGSTMRSGTSMATPYVTGAAVLLMEYGIVKANDPYLYGEKIKAYLTRGARHLPSFTEWPNSQMGYGALCLYDSIPKI